MVPVTPRAPRDHREGAGRPAGVRGRPCGAGGRGVGGGGTSHVVRGGRGRPRVCVSITAVRVSITTIHVSITAVHVSITTVRVSITTIHVSITTVRVSITTVHVSITTVRVSITTVRVSITAVHVSITTVRVSITTVRVSITTVRVSITAVHVSITTVRVSITTVRVSITAVRVSITTVRVSITTKDGKKHYLIINEATKEDTGRYKIMTNGGESEADIIVEEKQLEVLQGMADLTVQASEQAVFKCEVSDEKVTGRWFRNGVEVRPSKRIHISHTGRKKKGSQRWMKLNFEPYVGTTFEATRMIEGVLYEMRVCAVNAIGVSQPSHNTQPFMPIADEWVPANTELVERCGFTVRGLPTGEKLLFRVIGVNIAGKSPPATLAQPVTIREIVERPKIRLPRHLRQTYVRKVGEQVNLVIPFQALGGDVHVRNSEQDTVFFIRAATRQHSGEYQLAIRIENMEDAATVRLRVVERPGPPRNVHVTEVWGFTAVLEWEPPQDDGNAEITGYTVQKADTRTMEWFTVYEHVRPPRCTVPELVMGNRYRFRVFSENLVGVSENPGVSQNTADIPKAGDDPRFLARHSQGVLTLQIRKPGPFDGGTYGCRAVNELGEALTECRLEIRGAGGALTRGGP
ncbi:hypothetical protein Q9233_017594 [Columba guinea]|nr:hypothetical protein Q9233_017594 [Columba guinea]